MSSKTVIWACLGARVQRCMRPIDWEIHSADTVQTMLCPWRRHLELSPHVSQEGVRMGSWFTPRSNIQLEMSGYFSRRHRKGVLKGRQNNNKKTKSFSSNEKVSPLDFGTISWLAQLTLCVVRTLVDHLTLRVLSVSVIIWSIPTSPTSPLWPLNVVGEVKAGHQSAPSPCYCQPY